MQHMENNNCLHQIIGKSVKKVNTSNWHWYTNSVKILVKGTQSVWEHTSIHWLCSITLKKMFLRWQDVINVTCEVTNAFQTACTGYSPFVTRSLYDTKWLFLDFHPKCRDPTSPPGKRRRLSSIENRTPSSSQNSAISTEHITNYIR